MSTGVVVVNMTFVLKGMGSMPMSSKFRYYHILDRQLHKLLEAEAI